MIPIKEGRILIGPLFHERMIVQTVRPGGKDIWVLGLVGKESEQFRRVTLTQKDLDGLTILEPGPAYDGDPRLLRLGLMAYSLGVAWEFDPYFGLSISRVDPLPHQLAAVYDYLLKPARVRFLLLQAGGQANALRTLIKAEQDRGPDFLRLANALSALYPSGSEEKRLLDAMLLGVPR